MIRLTEMIRWLSLFFLLLGSEEAIIVQRRGGGNFRSTVVQQSAPSPFVTTTEERGIHPENSKKHQVGSHMQKNEITSAELWQWEEGLVEVIMEEEEGQAMYHRELPTEADNTTASTLPIETIKFAFIPTVATGAFSAMAGRGCIDAASRVGTGYECDILMQNVTDVSPKGLAEEQYRLVEEIVADNTKSYRGIAISPVDAKKIGPLLDRAVVDRGLIVITWNTDAASNKRHAFIGSNHTFLGIQLAKVLNQLMPNGGTFGTIFAPLGKAITERKDAFRTELLQNSDGVWTELPNSPSYSTTVPQSLQHMEEFAQQNVTAIAVLLNPPFIPVAYEKFVDRHRHKGIWIVGVGDNSRNLDLLARRYIQGIVGQLPYEMGYHAIALMSDILKGRPVEHDIIGTNVITHIQIPINLPALTVNENRVGSLAILGYVFFVMSALAGLSFGCWVWFNRFSRVVKASQPIFLLMVAAGMVIMCSGIIPLSFDDSQGQWDKHDVAICMSAPWLICTGFTITFSALFSKTSRVNRIFRAGSAIRRIQINTRDLLLKCLVLLLLNFVVLICWTVLDPLTYVREDDPGTDGWNRVISTSGRCKSNHPARYLIPLIGINLLCLGVANWQAYEARAINSEFSESKYIGIACISMMQTCLMGIPIMVVVQDNPEALYLVMVCMLFIVSMSVLLLIFVPKMVLFENYNRYSTRTQGTMMQHAIREQAAKKHSSKHSGTGSEKLNSTASAMDSTTIHSSNVKELTRHPDESHPSSPNPSSHIDSDNENDDLSDNMRPVDM